MMKGCMTSPTAQSGGEGVGERAHPCPQGISQPLLHQQIPNPGIKIATILGIHPSNQHVNYGFLLDVSFPSLPLTHILFSATPAGPNLQTHLSWLLGKCSL